MLRVAITALFVALAVADAGAKSPPDLLLISWKQSDGQWVFRVIPDNRWLKSTHDQLMEFALKTIEFERGVSRADVFGNLQLYANTPQRIIWVDYADTPLTYPPRQIVEEIKRYADTHHIKLSFEHVKSNI